MSSVSEFFNGMSSFFRGLGVLRKNMGLGVLVILPVVLTTIVYVGVFVGACFAFDHFKEIYAPATEEAGFWSGTLNVLAWIAFALVYLITGYLTFVAVGSLICSPFNDVLSDRIERSLLGSSGGAPPRPFGMLRDVLRSMGQEFKRLSVYLLLLICCLPVLFIPVLNGILFPALMGYISVRYLAWDGLDYSMGRRRWSFAEKSGFLRRHRARTVGFGTVCFLLLLIPFTALFVLPLNAASGTVLFCELVREDDPGTL